MRSPTSPNLLRLLRLLRNAQLEGSSLHCFLRLQPLANRGRWHPNESDCGFENLRPSQFAIRINMRNHSVMKRDDIIKQVAAIVGPDHKVDLTNYDLLILVDLYKVSSPFPLRLFVKRLVGSLGLLICCNTNPVASNDAAIDVSLLRRRGEPETSYGSAILALIFACITEHLRHECRGQ
jgi:hypothetical protein